MMKANQRAMPTMDERTNEWILPSHPEEEGLEIKCLDQPPFIWL